MGRGLKYPYEYCLLFDEREYVVPENEDGEFDEDEAYRLSELFWQEFYKNLYASMPKGFWKKEKHLDRYKRQLGYIENRNGNTIATVGMDDSGEIPCIYIEPEMYVVGSRNGFEIEKEYSIGEIVTTAFNKLIACYGDNFFKEVGGAWHCVPVKGKVDYTPAKRKPKLAVSYYGAVGFYTPELQKEINRLAQQTIQEWEQEHGTHV